MKKLKQTLAIFLSLALLALVAVFSSSAETAALESFKTAYGTLLSGVKDISTPQGCIDFVTAENALDVENAYYAFTVLSDDDKNALASESEYGADIANQLEAAYRRAMVFNYGTYFYNAEKDTALSKYLVDTQENYNVATTLPVASPWNMAYDAFRTAVRNDGAIPTTYIKKSPAAANTTDGGYLFARDAVFAIPVAASDTMVQTGVIAPSGSQQFALSGTEPVYLRATTLNLLKWNGKNQDNYSAANGDAVCTLEPWNTTKLTVAESSTAEMKGWVTKIGLNESATADSYYYSYDVYGLVDTAQHYTASAKNTTFTADQITDNLSFIFVKGQPKIDTQRINVDSIYINYNENENNNYADTIKSYLTGIDYSKMSAEDLAKISEYKKFVDYTADYATSANDFTDDDKEKLAGALKVAEYLKSTGKTGISTPADIDGIADEITKDSVGGITAIYNEYVTLSDTTGLNLGAIFTESQKSKIETAYKIAANLGDKASYKISAITGLIDEINAKSAEKVYNNIAYSVELKILEDKFNTVKNDGYEELITNSASLTALRTAYDSLVESGEYSAMANITLSAYPRKVTSSASINVPDVDTSNGIDELDITVTRGKTVYFNYSDCANDDYANAFGIYALNASQYTYGICLEMTSSYDYADTCKIPQDFYGVASNMRNNKNDTWRSMGVWSDSGSHIAASLMLCYTDPNFYKSESFLNDNYSLNENVVQQNNELRPKALKNWLTENGYERIGFKDNTDVTFNFKYMGDENTIRGYNYYIVSVTGSMYTATSAGVAGDLPADNGVISVNSEGLATIYAVILSDGRFTNFATTDSNAKLNSLKVNNVPNKLTNGASIRLASGNTSGIRFESTVDMNLYNKMVALAGKENVKLGTLIVPKDYLEDGTAFTIDALKAANKKYLDIAKTESKWQNEEKGIYTAAMINIKEANFDRSFAARGYMKVTVNGEDMIFYSSYNPALNARSVKYVASAALDDENKPEYTNAELEVLKRFAGR